MPLGSCFILGHDTGWVTDREGQQGPRGHRTGRSRAGRVASWAPPLPGEQAARPQGTRRLLPAPPGPVSGNGPRRRGCCWLRILGNSSRGGWRDEWAQTGKGWVRPEPEGHSPGRGGLWSPQGPGLQGTQAGGWGWGHLGPRACGGRWAPENESLTPPCPVWPLQWLWGPTEAVVAGPPVPARVGDSQCWGDRAAQDGVRGSGDRSCGLALSPGKESCTPLSFGGEGAPCCRQDSPSSPTWPRPHQPRVPPPPPHVPLCTCPVPPPVSAPGSPEQGQVGVRPGASSSGSRRVGGTKPAMRCVPPTQPPRL